MSIVLNPYYNNTIRIMTTLFGSLFNNIQLVRYDKTGLTELERQTVPMILGQKEKYFVRNAQDLNFTRSIEVSLPRMAYEFKGLEYDASRKQNTMLRNTSPDKSMSQLKDVPYNFHYTLSIYVRNIDDGAQIVEQILPYFTPSYTISNTTLISPLSLTRDIEVWPESINYEINAEGDPDEERSIIWTLEFIMKGWLFQPVATANVILQANTYFWDYTQRNGPVTALVLANTGIGLYADGEEIYQGESANFPNTIATVIEFDQLNNKLYVKDITGPEFSTNGSIVGITTGATYNLVSYYISSAASALIYIHPNPIAANTSNANVVIQISEFPFITSNG